MRLLSSVCLPFKEAVNICMINNLKFIKTLTVIQIRKKSHDSSFSQFVDKVMGPKINEQNSMKPWRKHTSKNKICNCISISLVENLKIFVI